MQKLSKAKLTFFSSLQLKKYRYGNRLFPVEGRKMVQEALREGWTPEAVIVEESRAESLLPLLEKLPPTLLQLCTAKEFAKLSSHESPEGIMAILPFPQENFCQSLPQATLPAGKGLLLEQIQDPGNLGALLRSADWFGIRYLWCSEGCADALNAKSLRSSMGAIFRVQLQYVSNWQELIAAQAPRIWAADMQGTALPDAALGPDSWILLGNEANGLRAATRETPGLRRLRIPGEGGAESLNVAVAGGILCYALALSGSA